MHFSRKNPSLSVRSRRYIGQNLRQMVDRPDGIFLFRLHKATTGRRDGTGSLEFTRPGKRANITDGKITMLLMGKLTISMAIFNSYVKLPEFRLFEWLGCRKENGSLKPLGRKKTSRNIIKKHQARWGFNQFNYCTCVQHSWDMLGGRIACHSIIAYEMW